MAHFIIRIELHGQSYDSPAYQRLHDTLAAKTVLRVVRGDDGATFQLPSATYAYEGDFTNVAVREWLSKIVTSLGYQYWIIVTAGYSSWQLPRA